MAQVELFAPALDHLDDVVAVFRLDGVGDFAFVQVESSRLERFDKLSLAHVFIDTSVGSRTGIVRIQDGHHTEVGISGFDVLFHLGKAVDDLVDGFLTGFGAKHEGGQFKFLLEYRQGVLGNAVEKAAHILRRRVYVADEFFLHRIGEGLRADDGGQVGRHRFFVGFLVELQHLIDRSGAQSQPFDGLGYLVAYLTVGNFQTVHLSLISQHLVGDQLFENTALVALVQVFAVHLPLGIGTFDVRFEYRVVAHDGGYSIDLVCLGRTGRQGILCRLFERVGCGLFCRNWLGGSLKGQASKCGGGTCKSIYLHGG